MIPTLFQEGRGRLIYDGRNQLRLFDIGGERFVVKSFQVPNIINRVAYGLLRSSKAQRSYENALLLESLGIGTPKPVACITFRKGLLFARSYYVSLESQCPYTYRDFFQQKEIPFRREALEKIGSDTARLHKSGFLHKDYSRGNLLFGRLQDDIRLEIVDLNRMRRGRVTMRQGCRNFERLPMTEEMRQVIATAYARERGYDVRSCMELMRFYRSRQKDLVEGKY